MEAYRTSTHFPVSLIEPVLENPKIKPIKPSQLLTECTINIELISFKKMHYDRVAYISSIPENISSAHIDKIFNHSFKNDLIIDKSKIIIEWIFKSDTTAKKEENLMLLKYLNSIVIASIIAIFFLIISFFNNISSAMVFDPVFHLFKILIPITWGVTALYAIRTEKRRGEE